MAEPLHDRKSVTSREVRRGPIGAALLVGALITAVAAGCGRESEDRLASQGGGAAAEPFAPPFTAREVPSLRLRAGLPKLVLLVVIDTLRADHLGCYGGPEGGTPFFDGFARHAVLFDAPLAPSAWTRPSMASLITSRYPTALDCLDKKDTLRKEELTLAEILTTRGGFRCLGVISNRNCGADFGFDQGFERFEDPPGKGRSQWPNDPKHARKVAGNQVTDLALEMLREAWEEEADQPVFLYAHYVDPHDPYFPHPDLMDEPEPPGRWNGSMTHLEEMDAAAGEQRPEDRERIRHLYRSEVRFVDRQVALLVDGALELVDSPEELMIVITADHGEGLWDHGERAHGWDVFDEQVRVPLLIRVPGGTKSDGRRLATPLSLVDVAPTILDVCEIEPPPSFQGRSLLPWMNGESGAPSGEFAYAELDNWRGDLETLRSQRYKIIRDRSKDLGEPTAFAFYDLSHDPREERDLIASGELDAEGFRIFEEMREHLWHWSRVIADSAPKEKRGDFDWATVDEESIRQLHALGYLAGEEYRAAMKANKKGAEAEEGSGKTDPKRIGSR